MSINKVEIQDNNGNIYYPHTDASIVKFGNSDVNTSLSNLLVYQTAGGTATKITLNLPVTLVEGYSITFIASADNNGEDTTINGIYLYEQTPDQVSPKLEEKNVYTVWYDGYYFFTKTSIISDIDKINASLSQNTQQLAQISNPNLLINGDFQVWQRGTTFSNVQQYTADRWKFVNWDSANSKSAGTLNKISEGLSLTGAIDQLFITQPFESDIATRLSGKTITLSVEVKVNNRTKGAIFLQIGSDVTAHKAITKDMLSSDYKKFSLTTTLPINNSKLDMAIGSFNNTDLGGIVNSDCTISIKNVKLELGSIATPFVPRLYAEELALCQRYYENNFLVGGSGIVDPNGNVALFIPYKVTKRIAPTVTVNSSLLSNCLSQVGYTAKTPTSIALSDRDINGNCTFFGGLTDAVGYNITIADNSTLKNLIQADAEIY